MANGNIIITILKPISALGTIAVARVFVVVDKQLFGT